MVKNRTHPQWERRHFAGVNEYGTPLVWGNGGTSWTATGSVTWDEVRKPTPEELLRFKKPIHGGE